MTHGEQYNECSTVLLFLSGLETVTEQAINSARKSRPPPYK